MSDRHQDTETLREEVKRLRADISAIASTLKDLAAEQGDAVSRRLRDQAERLQSQAEYAAGSVGTQVQEHPFTSVLSAFAIGALLGALFTRR